MTAEADTVITSAEQIEARRTAGQGGLIAIATDGGYSNKRFNRAINE